MFGLSLIEVLGWISVIAGSVAIFYWIKIYKELNKGSLAWLLLTLSSIFMITTPMYFYFYNTGIFRPEFIVFALMFWGAVYVSFFAAAGYTLNRTFTRVPRGSVGKYLMEGFQFREIDPIEKIDEKDSPLEVISKQEKEKARSEKSQDENTATEDGTLSKDDAGELQKIHYLGGFTDFLDNTALIQYTPEERYEDSIIEITLGYLAERRNAVLLTSAKRIEVYKHTLKPQIEKGVLKIVDLVETQEIKTPEKGIILLQKDHTDHFLEIIKDFPKRCMLLIENPLTSFKNNGKSNIELLTQIIEKSIENEIGVMAFLNTDEASEPEKNRLMDLFMTQAMIKENKITLIKGKKRDIELPVLNYVDYEKHALR